MLGSIGRKTFSRIGFEIATQSYGMSSAADRATRGRAMRTRTGVDNRTPAVASFASFIFLNYFRRNFLRRIAIIGRKSVEHFLVPDPVLQHLRRRLHEIPRHMRAGKTPVFRARDDRMQRVAEFVEQRFDLAGASSKTACPRSAAENCKATRQLAADIFHPATVCRSMISNCAK